ncbi:MAG: SRPBCC family protein [Planctomycetes bacterium]|nr:SRPBCC family protein [Planctomycetota bacterium]
MTSITSSRFVRASQAAAFALASDLRGAPSRIPAIVRLEVLTDGPIGVGTRFRETRRMFGREATEEMEVTSFDPPRSYAVGCESCGARYRSEFRFTPQDGGTEIRMEFAAEPLTAMAKVMGFLMRPMMKKMVQTCAKDLDHLADALERS